ncbi:MAG: hypothetical protein K2F99_03000 [Muribaculaceae bacterium]|nr:hypothetical protein [Muribaculaceae bacterium]
MKNHLKMCLQLYLAVTRGVVPSRSEEAATKYIDTFAATYPEVLEGDFDQAVIMVIGAYLIGIGYDAETAAFTTLRFKKYLDAMAGADFKYYKYSDIINKEGVSDNGSQSHPPIASTTRWQTHFAEDDGSASQEG